MAKRHPNHRRVKIHRNHSVQDLANLFGVHKNTVRAWHRGGLEAVDDRRPILFRGDAVVRFLQARRAGGKTKLAPGEIFCLPCRAPRRPAGDMVEYVPATPTSGNLRAICPVCDRLMHRRCNRDRIGLSAGDLHVSVPDTEGTLQRTSGPFVNCDFRDKDPGS